MKHEVIALLFVHRIRVDVECVLLSKYELWHFFLVQGSCCTDNGQLLDEAFELLRSNESRPAVDGPDLFSHDLFVLCAEAAIQVTFLFRKIVFRANTLFCVLARKNFDGQGCSENVLWTNTSTKPVPRPSIFSSSATFSSRIFRKR